MAFWALGALDKMKNITENLNIKNVKKVISYVASQSQSRPEPQKNPNNLFYHQKQDDEPYVEPKKVLTSKERMQIQLKQYKKLVKMQQQIIQKHLQKQKDELARKQSLLQKENLQLLELEQRQRKESSKIQLIERIQSGEKSIEQVISENILIRQKLMQSKAK